MSLQLNKIVRKSQIETDCVNVVNELQRMLIKTENCENKKCWKTVTKVHFIFIQKTSLFTYSTALLKAMLNRWDTLVGV